MDAISVLHRSTQIIIDEGDDDVISHSRSLSLAAKENGPSSSNFRNLIMKEMGLTDMLISTKFYSLLAAARAAWKKCHTLPCQH